MKYFTVFIVVLFSSHLGCDVLDTAPEFFDTTTLPAPNHLTGLKVPPQNDFTASSKDDYFDNISIQDFLSSDIDANERIENKISNAFERYKSNCQTYRSVNPSCKSFQFSQSSITVDLDSANAIFHNIRVSESSENSSTRKLYSTSIGCNSTKMTKIEVKLQKDLEIYADLKLIVRTNSSSGQKIPPRYGILDTGSVLLKLEQISISVQFTNETDDADNVTSKIFYSKSVTSLNIATEFQMQIHDKLETFFDAVESPLRKFLVEKLNAEFAKNRISASDHCPIFKNTGEPSKKGNLPFSNNNLNNLYVIPHSSREMWRDGYLSTGPILIDGLSNFNSTEFIISGNENDAESPNFHTTPRYDDREMKKMTVKIKTNDLKGKVQWRYNFEQILTSFIIEFVEFEIEEMTTFQYVSRGEDYRYNHDDVRRYNYNRSNINITDVNLNFGNLQTKSSNASVCENESKFLNFVLSGYLKTVIADWFTNSLKSKLQTFK